VDDKKPFHNPFAALKDKLGELPKRADAAVQQSPSEPPRKGFARAVVRLERKGRRGKEVTVVEQLGLRDRDLATWLKELKGALGCGGAIEDDTLVLQGDHRERLRALLEQRGVRRVTVG
jgi:translation initiation factor 1